MNEQSAEQPISGSMIREFYVRKLELRVRLSEIDLAQEKLSKEFEKAFSDRGLDITEWDVDLRAGTLSKRAPAPAETPAPEAP